ncbi:hypothetical protein NDU88_010142 [Pleurodeles waltl]|uniref:Uncharacterized protein n=1 Tax=Pleurodeles waltl TaxID=8319 RepID=A0AAV7S2E9_PLEWA|nr:hypothetical protein NDU88_010142 [Pleurodeles waltl]
MLPVPGSLAATALRPIRARIIVRIGGQGEESSRIVNADPPPPAPARLSHRDSMGGGEAAPPPGLLQQQQWRRCGVRA